MSVASQHVPRTESDKFSGMATILILVGLCVLSWIVLVLLFLALIWVCHALMNLPREGWLVAGAFLLGVAFDRFKVKRGWWKA